MVLFLAATHGPKTRLTSQGEHALIRPWLWTLASDVGSYTYCFGKLGQFPRTFMKTIYSNSDVSNDVLFRQEDKDCHQVKMWLPCNIPHRRVRVW